jgi:hypothetical protein
VNVAVARIKSHAPAGDTVYKVTDETPPPTYL